ncbi:MAG: ABC transporter ATP-binding protein [Eubacterium sp.]|nr:ABC transporter ATP-binding protein [Eubacterium sp.]
MSKRKNDSPVLKRLYSEIGELKGRFWRIIILVVIAKICLAIAPEMANRITDSLSGFASGGQLDWGKIMILCGFLAVFYLVGYGADGFVTRAMVSIAESIVRKLRNRCGEKLNRLSIGYLDSNPIGDTQARVTVDLLNLSTGMETNVAPLLAQLVLMIAIVIMMCITDFRLAVVYVVFMPIISFSLKFVVKRTRKLFLESNRAQGKVSAKVTDTFANHMILKAYGMEEIKRREMEALTVDFEKKFIRSRYISGFTRPVSNVLARLSYVLVCLLSGYFMLKGEMTLGEFTAFLFYGNMIATPMSELSVAINNFQDALSSGSRVYEFLDQTEEPEEKPEEKLDARKVKGEVAFDHVSFRYVADKPLMEDVSFTAKPGQTMAIVGPSGAGKTTLINLLMRFYEINSGTIRVDGTDISKISKENLRSMFGMVLQESWVLDGTIEDNIAFGRPGATHEEVVAAAKMAGCDEIIRKLPNGYQTHVGPENSALSAGENQLLAIARAVISDPKILILDEATSQVDTKTEAAITRAMEMMMEGRTTFIIAHRLYTIQNADQIIFMVNGDIKEVGNHQELLARGGLYASMYRTGLDD